MNICSIISKSSEIYYEYLKSNRKGISKTRVKNVTKVEDREYRLTFESKIRDINFIDYILCDGFKISVNKIRFTNSSFYHSNVIVPPHLDFYFNNTENMFLVTDYTQLILNIKERFDKCDYFALPKAKSSVSFSESDFPNVKFTDSQLDAIQNIFSKPLSYIWGGAGSGKTKYVLAYSIINYLKNKKRILLTAPTNIALENALSSVIPLATIYGIDESTIYRHGYPSAEFAEQFPKCCKNIEIDKKRKELLSKRDCIKDCIVRNKYLKTAKIIRYTIELAISVTAERERIIKESDEQSILFNLTDKHLDDTEKELLVVNNIINSIKLQKTSFKYRFMSKLKLTESLDNMLDYHYAELEKLYAAKESYKSRLQELEQSIADNKDLLNLLEQDICEYHTDIEKNLSPFLGSSLPYDDYNKINELLSDYEKDCSSAFDTLYYNCPEISSPDTIQLMELLDNVEKELLDNVSEIENARNNILLFGCTLDSLSVSDESNFSHAFLDEACYSSTTKVAQLFMYNCPVTFLGDHLQLPPVCEMNFKKGSEHDYSYIAFLWAQNGIYSCDLFCKDISQIYDEYINGNLSVPELLSVSMLNETHRFGFSLAKALDSYVYKSGFHSLSEAETQIEFINVPDNEETDEKRQNTSEALAIREYINTLPDKSDIAVITPYVTQVMILKNKLSGQISMDNILTIHKAQGQEWDTVILSVVDSKNKFFTDSNNTVSAGRLILNTAISRTKRKLVLVCNADYWKSLNNQLITGLLDIATEINLHIKN